MPSQAHLSAAKAFEMCVHDPQRFKARRDLDMSIPEPIQNPQFSFSRHEFQHRRALVVTSIYIVFFSLSLLLSCCIPPPLTPRIARPPPFLPLPQPTSARRQEAPNTISFPLTPSKPTRKNENEKFNPQSAQKKSRKQPWISYTSQFYPPFPPLFSQSRLFPPPYTSYPASPSTSS